ncbi:MAG: hypothetical protein ACRD5H_11490 [Nitrososphaerales archaeon]
MIAEATGSELGTYREVAPGDAAINLSSFFFTLRQKKEHAMETTAVAAYGRALDQMIEHEKQSGFSLARVSA